VYVIFWRFLNKTHCKIKTLKNVKKRFYIYAVGDVVSYNTHISQTITGVSFVGDHFSGTGRALGPLCVCVWAIAVEQNDLWPIYLARRLILTLSRSSSMVTVKVKFPDGCNRLIEKEKWSWETCYGTVSESKSELETVHNSNSQLKKFTWAKMFLTWSMRPRVRDLYLAKRLNIFHRPISVAGDNHFY